MPAEQAPGATPPEVDDEDFARAIADGRAIDQFELAAEVLPADVAEEADAAERRVAAMGRELVKSVEEHLATLDIQDESTGAHVIDVTATPASDTSREKTSV